MLCTLLTACVRATSSKSSSNCNCSVVKKNFATDATSSPSLNVKPEGGKSKYWTYLNTRRYFEKLADELGLFTQKDLYGLNTQLLSENGGNTVLQNHGGSLIRSIQYAFPEYTWHPWLFETCPRNFWTQMENKKMYLEWLGAKFGIEIQQQWYQVRAVDISRNGGYALLWQYNDSMKKLFSDVYPEFTWHSWLFSNAPDDFWLLLENRREYLDWISEEVGISKKEQWYEVTPSVFTQRGGLKLLQMYKNSISLMLKDNYPEIEWNHSNFLDINKQRQWFDRIAQTLGVQKQSDWYHVNIYKLQSPVVSFHSSYQVALQTVYPEFSWYFWLFPTVPDDFWDDIKNQRSYFEWLMDKLQIGEEELYHLKRSDVTKTGGRTVLLMHDNSLPLALMKVFPEKKWTPWLFDTCPKQYWKDWNNVNAFIEWISEKLSISETADWYKVTHDQLVSYGGRNLVRQNGGIQQLLARVFPDFPWDEEYFDSNLKSQSYLIKLIHELSTELSSPKANLLQPKT